MNQINQLACNCGRIKLEVEQEPIISTECHCASCRSAALRLQSLPSAPPFVNANGGTPLVLYRKDRVRILKGADYLKEFYLTIKATTRRVVGTCCNTPVFLEFKGAHWLNLYGCLWPAGTRPPLEIRTMTSDRPDAYALSDDVPNAKKQPVSFFVKLLGAWIAMGFRNPKFTVNGKMPI